MIEESYRQEIYDHYLGQTVDPDQFIRSLDQKQIDRQFKAWWKRKLPSCLNEPILDLGCGWGGFLAFLKTEGYTNLTGVDSSPQQIEIAQHLGLSQVEIGDVFTTLAKHQNYYSCIMAFNVLEHLSKQDILPFLRAIRSALKPGGVLLLELPNANSLFGSRTRYWDFTHEISFTPTSLRQILEITGFVNVQLQERAPIAYGIKSSIRSMLWKLIRQGLSFYLLVEQGSTGHRIFTQDMHAIAYKKSLP
jgi:SAM-dependent methyltransferase